MIRVLVVDDKPENLYLLRALLQGHGYEVEEARHGAEALAKARQAPPQLVIADLLMPVMDGYTLLRHWKADEQLKAIPFVVYTATYTDPRDEQLALELGADAFILKPAEPALFMARIDTVLAKEARGELAPTIAPVGEEKVLLKEYSEALIRKLEDKALQLEQANRELQEDIARRVKSETEVDRLLRETQRAREALLSILEDQRASEVSLKKSTQSYSTLVQNIAGAVYRCRNDADWTVDFISEGCFPITGYRAEELMGNRLTSLGALMHPEDAQPVWEKCQANLAAHRACSNEYRIVHRSGEIRWVWDQAQGIYSDAGALLFIEGLLTDITERERNEKALLESEARFHSLANLTSDWYWEQDEEFRFVSMSFNAEQKSGAPIAQSIGKRRWELPDAMPLSGTWAEHRAQVEAHQPYRDFQYRRSDDAGAVFYQSVSGEPVFDDSGAFRGYRGTAIDISARMRLDAALRESVTRTEALTRRLLEVQETERRTIARELHDEVGGVLTAVKLNLQSLGRPRPGRSGKAAVADGLALVDGAIQAVRSLSLDLRPAVLDDLGLIPALKWYCERQAQRAGVPIELALDAIDLKPSHALESACFRIVQEAVTNALRHANARRIQVALRRDDGSFVLEIADDGAGFDVAAARKRGLAGEASGLLGMEERTTLLGGRFEVESAPGAGARVRAEFAVPDGGFA